MSPLPLSGRALGALSLGALPLLWAPSAAAQPQPQPRAEARPALRLPLLSVHRTSDTLDCPDARALAAQVARHMKRPALDPVEETRAPLSPNARGATARSSLDVQIYRSEEGYTAVVQAEVAAPSLDAPGGARPRTRQLSDKGSTCAGLTAALPITMAILLDTEVPLPPPSPEPAPAPDRGLAASPSEPPPPDRPADADQVAVSPGRDAAGAGAAFAGSETPGRTAASARPEGAGRGTTAGRSFGLSVGYGIGVADGVLQRAVLSEAGLLEIWIGRWISLGAGLLVFTPQTFRYTADVPGAGPGLPEIETWLTAGLFRGCASLPIVATAAAAPVDPGDPGALDRTRVGLCLGAVAGAIHGEAHNLPRSSPATDPWAAAELSGLVEQRLFGPLFFRSRAALLLPFVKRAFEIEGVGTAFSPAPAGVALDAELRLSIW